MLLDVLARGLGSSLREFTMTQTINDTRQCMVLPLSNDNGVAAFGQAPISARRGAKLQPLERQRRTPRAKPTLADDAQTRAFTRAKFHHVHHTVNGTEPVAQSARCRISVSDGPFHILDTGSCILRDDLDPA